jgi:hypothetical protein
MSALDDVKTALDAGVFALTSGGGTGVALPHLQQAQAAMGTALQGYNADVSIVAADATQIQTLTVQLAQAKSDLAQAQSDLAACKSAAPPGISNGAAVAIGIGGVVVGAVGGILARKKR